MGRCDLPWCTKGRQATHFPRCFLPCCKQTNLFILQVDESITGFFGGLNDPTGIETFDWKSMTYTYHGAKLSGKRQFSACALLNGNSEVAVVSGLTAGIETWNTIDGSTKVLNATFPRASGNAQTPQLISVKNGLELIYYETWHMDSPDKGIWKYTLTTNTWSKIGEMAFARDDFVALPVKDLSCN